MRPNKTLLRKIKKAFKDAGVKNSNDLVKLQDENFHLTAEEIKLLEDATKRLHLTTEKMAAAGLALVSGIAMGAICYLIVAGTIALVGMGVLGIVVTVLFIPGIAYCAVGSGVLAVMCVFGAVSALAQKNSPEDIEIAMKAVEHAVKKGFIDNVESTIVKDPTPATDQIPAQNRA